MLGKSFDESSPLFLQIKARLEDLIIDGSLQEDEQVPSTTQIVQFYKIKHLTVSKGVNLLVDENILYKKRGLGIFVSPGAKEQLLQKRQDGFIEVYLRPMIQEANRLEIEEDWLIQMIRGEKIHE